MSRFFKLYDYATDREWADRFTPEAERIITPFCIRRATEHEDKKLATDLVITARAIGVRIREYRYWLRLDWRKQFTLRLHRESGVTTEFEKIIAGRGDWFFYAFACNDLSFTFVGWRLLNLHNFRVHWPSQRQQINWDDQDNGDGTHFRWFQVSSFPPTPPIQIGASQQLLDEDKPYCKIPPLLPGWDQEKIQTGGTITKREFELEAIKYAEKGPRDDSQFRYKGPFTL